MVKPAPTTLDPTDPQSRLPLVFNLAHRILVILKYVHGISAPPLGRILLHPASIAAWVGMYATALNLLPSSQLDGGHIIYALAPRMHRASSWITAIVRLYLGRPDTSAGEFGPESARYCDECAHVPATASAGVSNSARQSLGSGTVRGDHAGAHLQNLSISDELVISEVAHGRAGSTTERFVCGRNSRSEYRVASNEFLFFRADHPIGGSSLYQRGWDWKNFQASLSGAEFSFPNGAGNFAVLLCS